MPRTTAPLVIGVLTFRNYDQANNIDLTPFIASAGLLIDAVVACALAKGVALTDVQAEMLERWMAAHYYTKSDPVYQARTTAGASGQFVRNPKEPEPYKDAAVSMDPSGCLKAIMNNRTARMDWLGKRPSEQIDISQRG